MKQNRLFAIVAISLMVGFSSCTSDDDGTPANSLDQDLQAALATAGGAEGANAFLLPESDDYANIPADPLNPITEAKVELGKFLFHETAIGLGAKYAENVGTYGCASCHHVAAGFQAGTAQGIGEGGSGFGTSGEARTRHTNVAEDSLDVQPIRSPSALNIAYQTNILWNGQFGATHLNVGTEAQWTAGTPKFVNNLGYEGTEIQAIAAQDVHRLKIEGSVAETNASYIQMFDDAFSGAYGNDNITQETAGLAIAAYERILLSTEAPFQKYLKGETGAMTEAQKRGAITFFGKGNCVSCHGGPSLANMEFYGMGMKDIRELPNIFQAQPEDEKGRGGFTGVAADLYKYKVPQLYNLKDSPFYGHGASFTTVRGVVEYMAKGEVENANVPASQISPAFVDVGLSDTEITELTDFVENALHDANLQRYVPETLPSGNCFPVSDDQAKTDLGCN
jgi:cytochrome c peroxidase